ncbi:MAG: hypothetical protein ACLPPV_21305 [Candidatus Korobacteraceae bacterium]|jgi:hypothetical protein
MVNLLLPIDPEWRLRDGWTKWIFPPGHEGLAAGRIVWRKDKQGFINRESEWLKNELWPATRLQSFETEVLTQPENPGGLTAVNRELPARAEAIESPRRVVPEMDRTEVPVYG